jgi:hypothetical protein
MVAYAHWAIIQLKNIGSIAISITTLTVIADGNFYIYIL